MDHLDENPVSREVPATENVIPSVSENPAVRELILGRALEAENCAEENSRFSNYGHTALNEHGYIPTMAMDARFLPPRSVPPDIGQRNPWSMSTQLSSNRHTATPDVIHHPSPALPSAITLSPHPSITENQFMQVPPPPPVHGGAAGYANPPPIHGGVPGYANYQAPGIGMANHAHNHPFPFPYYYPMPPIPIQPPNPVRTLPTLTHIPLLNGRLDFAPWDSGIRSILRSLGLIGHIAVPGDPIDPLRPETLPSYPPTLAQGYGQAELMGYRQWWDRDAIADHIVTTRLSNLVRASLPPDNILGTRTARAIYEAIRQLYGL